MKFPIGLEDVKLLVGHGGKGAQVMCLCGCANMQYLEVQEPTWKCRNCGRLFTHDFRGLVDKVRAREKLEEAAAAPAATTANG